LNSNARPWPCGLCVLVASLVVTSCASTQAIRPFSEDGCSRFPDGTVSNRELWKSCCHEHDQAYWRGGAREERHTADRELRECVDQVRNPVLAGMMYAGVRAGGGAWWPTRYRWGYGWPYGRGYRRLSEEEQQSADELLLKSDVQKPSPASPE
jgi:hypothetical protein